MIAVNQIQQRLCEALKKCEITQTELAKQLGITQSSISHYIKGDIMPSLDTFANLCEVLKLDPAYILCLTD